jgi:hypothetical protein
MTAKLSPPLASHRTHRSPVAAQAPCARTTVAAAGLRRRREILSYVLGGIWLIDGVLQFQPFMYSSAFPGTLRDAGHGSPTWISGPVNWSANLMAQHLGTLNTLSALLQVAIGVGLMMPRARRAALAASFGWGLLVWWLGEGMGTLFAGPVSALDGLPGAALLYVLISVLLWPAVGTRAASVAAANPVGARAAKIGWLAFWSLFVWETLRSSNRSPLALHDMISAMGDGEPGWIKAIDGAGASALDHYGTQASVILAALFAAVAFAVFLAARYTRPLLVLAMVLAAIIWTVGQDFGAVATHHATDLNSGPLLALLALCYWPVNHRPSHDATPGLTRRPA